MNRRDLLMAGACIAGAGATLAMKPHRHVPLLVNAKLENIVPTSFGGWTSEDVGDPLAINGPNTLSSKLYNQLLVRSYTNASTGERVLMLLAYGERQTDDLQLHRPEICYPAFGFALVRNDPIDIQLGHNVVLPGRKLLAVAQQTTESVVYWTRIGEYLPRSAAEQRGIRLNISMHGIIPDGVLCRFSSAPLDSREPWREIQGFLPEFIASIAPDQRKVLVGSERGRELVSLPRATA